VHASIAALAAGRAAFAAAQLPALERLLTSTEQQLSTLAWPRATRLALDLYEVHARLLLGAPACAGPARGREHAALAHRAEALLAALKEQSDALFAADRARLVEGALRGAELMAWLAAYPPEQRDPAIEQLFGIAYRPLGRAALDADLVDYVPSGIAPIVRAVMDVPIGPSDVFVDLGAGLGKVALAVHLLSGARVRGIELQERLVLAATRRVEELRLKAITYEMADARLADLSDADVVFLYLPFTGATLVSVMRRIEEAARRRSLVVCTLGLDLRAYGWLEERVSKELWLSIYDSRFPEVPPREPRPRQPLGDAAEWVASEK
jgi:SAM-dependent methyltransferase